MNFTVSKVFAFGVILVHIFLHSDWIRRDTSYLSVFSPNAAKNKHQNNSEHKHFLRSACEKITMDRRLVK